nr:ribonuclease H-like domain-containing protein [Tanacetum cinerariifolium]
MSDHEDETITEENAPPKNIPQITTGNSAKSMTTDKDGNLKIRPPVTAEEHQQFLEIDTKGYSSSSSTLSNAAFVSTAGSSQGKLSYHKSGNDSYGGYTTTLSASPGSSSFKGSSKSKCSVVDDVIYSFFANHEIDQQLVYEDLDQMNKEEFEEYDLKHYMAMLSIKVHRFEKKHSRKIKFNGRENARFDKKLVTCFNCKKMGHFSRECRAQGGQNSNNYQKYKEAGKDETNSKAMVVVDGSVDWDKQTEEGNTEPRSLENFCMLAGIKLESDADSEGEVVFADDVIPAVVFVSAGLVVAAAADSPHSETEFAFMGLSTEVSIHVTCPLCYDSKYKLIEKDYHEQREQLNDCVVDLKAHKHAVKSLEKHIKCHQTNQLAYEEKIKVLSYELEEKSNILEYRQKLIDQTAQEKKELMSKLENKIANQAKWNNSGRNLYKLIDSSMSVRTKRGLGLDKYIEEGELELQHFNLISVSQICDQSHRVLFTKNEYMVLSKDFPLPDPSLVILSIPRKHNLYTFSLNELAPKGPLTCLIAKASQNESTLWHKRLGHVNFRNMNKLIFEYLTAYPKLGLWYPRDSPFDLEAFSDSDY